jgi:hypothetical protein
MPGHGGNAPLTFSTWQQDSSVVCHNPISFVLEAANAGFASAGFAPDSGGWFAPSEPTTLSLLGLGALSTVVKTGRRRHSAGSR